MPDGTSSLTQSNHLPRIVGFGLGLSFYGTMGITGLFARYVGAFEFMESGTVPKAIGLLIALTTVRLSVHVHKKLYAGADEYFDNKGTTLHRWDVAGLLLATAAAIALVKQDAKIEFPDNLPYSAAQACKGVSHEPIKDERPISFDMSRYRCLLRLR